MCKGNSRITDEDVPYIVNFLSAYPSITAVDLSDNNIGSIGTVILALQLNTIKTLNLSNNPLIGLEGAQALAKNTTITALDVSSSLYGSYSRATVKTLLQWQHDRMNAIAEFKKHKVALLMGTHKNTGQESAILNFSNNSIYENKLFHEIFSLIEPQPLTLLHSFEPELVTAFTNSITRQEIQQTPDEADQETKELHEDSIEHEHIQTEIQQMRNLLEHQINEAMNAKYAPHAQNETEAIATIMTHFSIPESSHLSIYYYMRPHFETCIERLNIGACTVPIAQDTFIEMLEEELNNRTYQAREIQLLRNALTHQANEAMVTIRARFSITEEQYNDIHAKLNPHVENLVASLNQGELDLEDARDTFVEMLEEALNIHQAEVEQRLARQRVEAEVARATALARRQVELSVVHAPVEAPGERGEKIRAVCRKA